VDVEKWGRERVCVCKRVWKGFCGPMKECVFGKGTCSLSGTEGKAKVFAFVAMGVDRKASTRGGGALERGHGAPLERLAELGDALGSVGAAATTINAAELVVGQAAKERRHVNGR